MKKVAILAGVAGAAAAVVFARKYKQAVNEDSLAGEVVLITGGSRGLGLALAREFTNQGCKVAICARDQEELDSAASDLRKRGAEVFTVRADVSVQTEINHAVDATKERFGRIDTLVNNAGVIQVGPVESLNTADFEKAINTIFWGTVYPTLRVLPQMEERGSGRIVNISSIGGKLGVPHLLPYVSAKFAVAGFSQALAAEMKPRGIAVTAIFPGLMRTGSFVQALFKGDQAKEADWFTAGATLPGISMDTDRAARQMVAAVRRRSTEETLSLPAKAAAAANALFPGGVTDLLGFVTSAILPDPKKSGDTKSGKDVWPRIHPVVRMASTLGMRALKNYNQRVKVSAI